MPTTITDRYWAISGVGAELVDYVESYGIDITPYCKQFGIDPKVFKDLTGRVSVDRFCRLLEACAEEAGDDAFGLKYSKVYSYGSTGAYGYGLMVAPNVREFFRFKERHMPFVSATTYCRFTERDDVARFQWSYPVLVLKRDQLTDMMLSLIIAVLEKIAGPVKQSIQVGLERKAPADVAPYREYLAKTVRFEQETNFIEMPRRILDIVNPKADARLFELMDIQCKAFHPAESNEDELLRQLREFISLRLRDEQVSLTDAAQYFGVAERTLQRRLAEQGTTLNDIRDEVRRELAGKLLVDTALSASDISYRLGYSAPSAFTRSFQRWYGQSPKAFRKGRVVN